ncbi:hypothetical protein BDZ94DRAFT_550554 [Collybia nuda]|uniref:Uncharacterized protein n=1 Tax=Collybia nuda TaxID=64659 RepID=A0A9P5YJB7_9AGAR|nr:hypothetical protein BDZ94DRAFT_550554 [Collybia nuda]
MPCVGEEPITSFFKRVTAKSRPKESATSSSVLSAVKRKQPAIEDSEANQWKPKKQSRLVLHNAPQNVAGCISVESRSRQTGSIHRKSLTTPRPVKNPPAGNPATNKTQVTHTSQLPTPVTVRRPGRLPADISLQTPPPTIYQGQKRRNPIVQNMITSIPQTFTQGMDEPLLQGEESILDLLSPPSVADDSCIMQPCRIPGVQHDVREPDTPEVLRACSEDPFYVFPSSQDHVPSSQTQDSEFSLTSLSFRNSAIPDRTGSKISGTSWNSLSATIPEPTDDCQYIHSSQTQHMLPYHISPRRNCTADSSRARTLSLHTLLDEYTDEIIPSSQSQIEIELDVSKEISDCPPRTIITTTPLNEVGHKKSLARSFGN